MKHIFLFDEHISSKQNGVGTFMGLFLECMTHIDGEVNFVSFNDEDHFQVCEKDGYRYYKVPFCNHGGFLKTGGLIFPLLSLYVKDTDDNLFFINHSPCADFMKALRKSFPKSKIIFTIHDQGWTSPCLGNANRFKHILSKRSASGKEKKAEQFVRKYYRNECLMYHIAHAVVCLNSKTHELLQDTYKVPKEKIWLIPNSIKINDISLNNKEQVQKHAKISLGIALDERVFLFVGRPTKAKGLFELLSAYDELFMQYPNTRLVIAGGVDNLSECTKYSQNSAAHVVYTGLIPKDKLALWYNAADVGVLPSYTEQCSFAGLEMMQRIGVIVTTDGWGITDMFQKDQNAIVANIPYDSDNIETDFKENLKQALIKACLLTPKYKEYFVSQNEIRLKENYNAKDMQFKYTELINSL